MQSRIEGDDLKFIAKLSSGIFQKQKSILQVKNVFYNGEFGKTILFKCAGLFSELKTSDSALIKVIILCSYQVFSSDIFPMLHFLSYKLCQNDEPF